MTGRTRGSGSFSIWPVQINAWTATSLSCSSEIHQPHLLPIPRLSADPGGPLLRGFRRLVEALQPRTLYCCEFVPVRVLWGPPGRPGCVITKPRMSCINFVYIRADYTLIMHESTGVDVSMAAHSRFHLQLRLKRE